MPGMVQKAEYPELAVTAAPEANAVIFITQLITLAPTVRLCNTEKQEKQELPVLADP